MKTEYTKQDIHNKKNTQICNYYHQLDGLIMLQVWRVNKERIQNTWIDGFQ